MRITTYVHVGKGKRIYISNHQTEKSRIDHIVDSLYKLRSECFADINSENLLIKPVNFYRNDKELCNLFERFVLDEVSDSREFCRTPSYEQINAADNDEDFLELASQYKDVMTKGQKKK